MNFNRVSWKDAVYFTPLLLADHLLKSSALCQNPCRAEWNASLGKDLELERINWDEFLASQYSISLLFLYWSICVKKKDLYLSISNKLISKIALLPVARACRELDLMYILDSQFSSLLFGFRCTLATLGRCSTWSTLINNRNKLNME